MGGETKTKAGSATAVLLDRTEDNCLVLRFLLSDVVWDVHTKEVRLTPDLAEQLLKMLEVEMSSETHELQSNLKYQFAI